jgi:hypothetical protein
MTTFDIEDSQLETLPLELDRRVTLGAAQDAPEQQLDRLSVGRPLFRALDAAGLDEDTRQFLSDRPKSRFGLLALTCSFRFSEDEPLEKSWLEATMRTLEPADADSPVAWSMEPRVLQDAVTISRVVKLDMSLQLTSEVVPIEVGPTAGRETTTGFTRNQPYVEAFREGTARPSWIFTRTKVSEIRGLHRLRAVVELPAGSSGEVEVTAGATVRHKWLGLITYRSTIGQAGELQRIPLQS